MKRLLFLIFPLFSLVSSWAQKTTVQANIIKAKDEFWLKANQVTDIVTDTSFIAASNLKLATQLAVKKYTDSRIGGRAYSTATVPTTGYVIKWDGTKWAPAADAGTTYTGGAGISITGSTITNSGLLASTTFGGDVTGTYDNLQIGAGKVGTLELTTTGTSSGSFTLPTLTTGPDGRVYSISSNTIGGDVSGSVGNIQIMPEVVGTTELTDNSVTTAKIGAAQVTMAKIAQAGATTNQAIVWNGTAWAPATVSGGGGGTPAGSTGQIQFNNAGAFGASANLFWSGTNLGIGTSSPGAKFHTIGGGEQYWMLESTATGYSGIVFKSGTQAFNYLFFNAASGNDGTFVLGALGSGGGTNKKLAVGGGVSIGNGYASTNMTVPNSLIVQGNVGFGTTSPLRALHVAGGSPLQIDVSSYTGNNIIIQSTRSVALGGGFGIEFKDATDGISKSLFYNYGTWMFGGSGQGYNADGNKRAHFYGGVAIGSGSAYLSGYNPNGLLVEGNCSFGTATSSAKVTVFGTGGTTATSSFVAANSSGEKAFEVRDDRSLIAAQYPNTRNDSGSPVNVFSSSSAGILESHTAAELVAAGGGVTANIATGNLTSTGSYGLTLGNNTLTFDASISSSTISQSLIFKGKADGVNSSQPFTFTDAANNPTGYLYHNNQGLTLAGTTGKSIVIGSGTFGWVFHPNGIFVNPTHTSDPTTTGLSGSQWLNITTNRFKFRTSSGVKTVATLEDDLAGMLTTFATDVTPIGASYGNIVDAFTTSRTVTLGSDMTEGRIYTIKARRNSTNVITVNAAASHTLELDGDPAIGPTTFNMDVGEVFTAQRFGTIILINR